MDPRRRRLMVSKQTANPGESLPGEHLWQSANADIAALQTIISTHFHAQCRGFEPLNSGSFARVFLFSLENNIQVVGRVVLPVRESFKTEAEVAAMELVRGTAFYLLPFEYSQLHISLFEQSSQQNTCPSSLSLLLYPSQSRQSRVDPDGVYARPHPVGLLRNSHLATETSYCYRPGEHFVLIVQYNRIPVRFHGERFPG